jgi:hypothetical protein
MDAAAVKKINGRLQKYAWPLLLGMCGVLLASRLYRLLEEDRVMLFCIVVFFAPILAHAVLAIGKRLVGNAEWLRKLYLASSVVLFMVATGIWANAAMDRSAVRAVQTSVTHRGITSGRYSTTYHLFVTSWRAGKMNENLRVSRDIYYSMSVGEAVVVKVHRGFLGMGWYGQITPTK